MSRDQAIIVSKAAPIHAGDEVEGRIIAIVDPGTDFTGPNVVAEATAFFRQQAELIHEALTASLPGGTLSNLFALMAADRASIFRVLDPAAHIAEPAPADDDVVDAHVVGFEDQLRTAIAHQWAAIRALENRSASPGERIAAARELLRYDLDAEPTDHVALVAQRAEAVALHSPCHTAQTKPWECTHAHHGYESPANGVPADDQTAQCTICTDGNESPLPYPCPTAWILGVRS